MNDQLIPLLRADQVLDLQRMKESVKTFLAPLLRYGENERVFMNRFYDEGNYEPELIFTDKAHIENLKRHPAVLWKLQNHRKHFGME